jgi:hypothetical protein
MRALATEREYNIVRYNWGEVRDAAAITHSEVAHLANAVIHVEHVAVVVCHVRAALVFGFGGFDKVQKVLDQVIMFILFIMRLA